MKCFLFLLLVCSLTIPVWAQVKVPTKPFPVKTNDAVQPTGPSTAHKAPKFTPSRKDTIAEADLTVFYQDKGCPVDKSMDGNGCVTLTYEDSTKHIMCGQKETVITPDGKIHTYAQEKSQMPDTKTGKRRPIYHAKTFVAVPPDDPTDQSVLTWLTKYNESLLETLLGFANKADQPALKDKILSKEQEQGLSLYGKLANRVNLLEQFAQIR